MEFNIASAIEEKKKVLTRQPVEICAFSWDKNRQYFGDRSSMRYYLQPPLPASLSTGFDKLVEREGRNEHLEALLSAIIMYEREHGPSKTQTDIVTWRGMITKLLCLAFSRSDAFEMNCCKFDGQIFIEEYVSPTAKAAKIARESGRNQKLTSYWGVKFETLSTIPGVWDETPREVIEGRDAEVVNTNVQYCSVVRSRIGGSSLILGGEVDCVYDFVPEADEEGIIQGNIVDHYCELKTSKLIKSDRDKSSFEKFKMSKFWAQSFLLGVPRIIVGFRDEEGVLREVEEFETLKIPGIVKNSYNAWDGNTGLLCVDKFLHFVKHTLSSDQQQHGGAMEGWWRISYVGGDCIRLTKESEIGFGDILTQEFIDWRRNRAG